MPGEVCECLEEACRSNHLDVLKKNNIGTGGKSGQQHPGGQGFAPDDFERKTSGLGGAVVFAGQGVGKSNGGHQEGKSTSTGGAVSDLPDSVAAPRYCSPFD